jgi:hypothetical protein
VVLGVERAAVASREARQDLIINWEVIVFNRFICLYQRDGVVGSTTRRDLHTVVSNQARDGSRRNLPILYQHADRCAMPFSGTR